MRQALGPGALGKPRGSGWRGRWEAGSGWGNTCKPMAVSFQCMTKFTTNKKKKLNNSYGVRGNAYYRLTGMFILYYIYIYIYMQCDNPNKKLK